MKQNQSRAVTVQPGARGVVCTHKNEKQRTIKSKDREKTVI
jgi:hypothetical protein